MEKLISFETAKLGKEKGCDIRSQHAFTMRGNGDLINPIDFLSITNSIQEYNKEHDFIVISRWPQTILQQWLREKHNILVSPMTAYTQKIINDKLVHTFKPSIEIIDIIGENIFHSDIKYDLFHELGPMTYEEAFEIGLITALNLIDNELNNTLKGLSSINYGDDGVGLESEDIDKLI